MLHQFAIFIRGELNMPQGPWQCRPWEGGGMGVCYAFTVWQRETWWTDVQAWWTSVTFRGHRPFSWLQQKPLIRRSAVAEVIAVSRDLFLLHTYTWHPPAYRDQGSREKHFNCTDACMKASHTVIYTPSAETDAAMNIVHPSLHWTC